MAKKNRNINEKNIVADEIRALNNISYDELKNSLKFLNRFSNDLLKRRIDNKLVGDEFKQLKRINKEIKRKKEEEYHPNTYNNLNVDRKKLYDNSLGLQVLNEVKKAISVIEDEIKYRKGKIPDNKRQIHLCNRSYRLAQNIEAVDSWSRKKGNLNNIVEIINKKFNDKNIDAKVTRKDIEKAYDRYTFSSLVTYMLHNANLIKADESVVNAYRMFNNFSLINSHNLMGNSELEQTKVEASNELLGQMSNGIIKELDVVRKGKINAQNVIIGETNMQARINSRVKDSTNIEQNTTYNLQQTNNIDADNTQVQNDPVANDEEQVDNPVVDVASVEEGNDDEVVIRDLRDKLKSDLKSIKNICENNNVDLNSDILNALISNIDDFIKKDGKIDVAYLDGCYLDDKLKNLIQNASNYEEKELRKEFNRIIDEESDGTLKKLFEDINKINNEYNLHIDEFLVENNIAAENTQVPNDSVANSEEQVDNPVAAVASVEDANNNEAIEAQKPVREEEDNLFEVLNRLRYEDPSDYPSDPVDIYAIPFEEGNDDGVVIRDLRDKLKSDLKSIKNICENNNVDLNSDILNDLILNIDDFIKEDGTINEAYLFGYMDDKLKNLIQNASNYEEKELRKEFNRIIDEESDGTLKKLFEDINKINNEYNLHIDEFLVENNIAEDNTQVQNDPVANDEEQVDNPVADVASVEDANNNEAIEAQEPVREDNKDYFENQKDKIKSYIKDDEATKRTYEHRINKIYKAIELCSNSNIVNHTDIDLLNNKREAYEKKIASIDEKISEGKEYLRKLSDDEVNKEFKNEIINNPKSKLDFNRNVDNLLIKKDRGEIRSDFKKFMTGIVERNKACFAFSNDFTKYFANEIVPLQMPNEIVPLQMPNEISFVDLSYSFNNLYNQSMMPNQSMMFNQSMMSNQSMMFNQSMIYNQSNLVNNSIMSNEEFSRIEDDAPIFGEVSEEFKSLYEGVKRTKSIIEKGDLLKNIYRSLDNDLKKYHIFDNKEIDSLSISYNNRISDIESYIKVAKENNKIYVAALNSYVNNESYKLPDNINEMSANENEILSSLSRDKNFMELNAEHRNKIGEMVKKEFLDNYGEHDYYRALINYAENDENSPKIKRSASRH